MNEDVKHQSHYEVGKVQPIELMQSTMSEEAFQGFLQGNVIKYASRYPEKNGLEDLNKAKVYLDWLIDSYQFGKDAVLFPEKVSEEPKNNIKVGEYYRDTDGDIVLVVSKASNSLNVDDADEWFRVEMVFITSDSGIRAGDQYNSYYVDLTPIEVKYKVGDYVRDYEGDIVRIDKAEMMDRRRGVHTFPFPHYSCEIVESVPKDRGGDMTGSACGYWEEQLEESLKVGETKWK